MSKKLASKTLLGLVLVYTVALLTVSLIKLSIDESSTVNFKYADKIFHFCAYFGLTFLWQIYYFIKRNITRPKPSIWIWVFAALFGIIIEVLQGELTTYRGFEWFDVVANSSGALLAFVVLSIYNPLNKVLSYIK